MLRNQWHIGVHQSHLVFEGPMQLKYNVLVSLMNSTQDHIWLQMKVCLEQNISIESFHASFHYFS